MARLARRCARPPQRKTAERPKRRVAWKLVAVVLAASLLAVAPSSAAADVGAVKQYHVIELSLDGPDTRPRDAPARDIEWYVTFRHESDGTMVCMPGLADGAGRGGKAGNVFKVRFCPPEPGVWTVVETRSNSDKLRGR
jgi:hypothetical protein